MACPRSHSYPKMELAVNVGFAVQGPLRCDMLLGPLHTSLVSFLPFISALHTSNTFFFFLDNCEREQSLNSSGFRCYHATFSKSGNREGGEFRDREASYGETVLARTSRHRCDPKILGW